MPRIDHDDAYAVRYYDRDGQRISRRRWSELWRSNDYRRVDAAEYGRLLVSTVWLGLDHAGVYDEIRPQIFETMVFGPDEDGALDWIGEATYRWRTEAEALEGHRRILGALRILRPLPQLTEGTTP
jgi:hypothetical protein